jgi:hypothetical protein
MLVKIDVTLVGFFFYRSDDVSGLATWKRQQDLECKAHQNCSLHTFILVITETKFKTVELFPIIIMKKHTRVCHSELSATLFEGSISF